MIRKTLLAAIFIFSAFSFSFAQAWSPVGDQIRSDYGILTLATYNNQMYAGGWFYSFGEVQTNNMASWNGTSWDSVGSGLTGGQNYVGALCLYNGKLYACGSFFAAEHLPANNIAVWDGTHWDTVTTKGLQYCGNGTGWADAMVVYDGKLYVAGAFCSANGATALNIASWDGTQWDSVSSGINDSVNALAVYNGKLYAGGQFTRAGTKAASNIACWNDTTWSAVGSGTNEPVYALQVYKGSLYVGGDFTKAGGISTSYIAKLNDTTWSSVGAGITGSGGVEAFCVFNGLLYTGGEFNKSGTLIINNVASWNGTVWDTVSKEGIDGTVDAFAVMDSNLYAGGIFTVAGKVNAIDIAMWGKTSLGIKQITNTSENVTIFPNPNNGLFTIQFVHPESLIGNTLIDIYNVVGQKVFSETLKTDQSNNQVSLTNQPAGVYFYRILSESDMLIAQGKIIVE